jgi:hypothetical protein
MGRKTSNVRCFQHGAAATIGVVSTGNDRRGHAPDARRTPGAPCGAPPLDRFALADARKLALVAVGEDFPAAVGAQATLAGRLSLGLRVVGTITLLQVRSESTCA